MPQIDHRVGVKQAKDVTAICALFSLEGKRMSTTLVHKRGECAKLWEVVIVGLWIYSGGNSTEWEKAMKLIIEALLESDGNLPWFCALSFTSLEWSA